VYLQEEIQEKMKLQDKELILTTLKVIISRSVKKILKKEMRMKTKTLKI